MREKSRSMDGEGGGRDEKRGVGEKGAGVDGGKGNRGKGGRGRRSRSDNKAK